MVVIQAFPRVAATDRRIGPAARAEGGSPCIASARAEYGSRSSGARMKIYSGPLSMFGAKAEIAAHEKGLPFELEMVPFDANDGYSPRHPEVLRINPKRQVPVLVDGELEIFDSTQIFEYLEHRWPEPPLWPGAPSERARARLLEHLSDEVFFAHVIRLMVLEDQRE